MMKVLAVLCAANVMVLPVACPLLAGVSVVAMGVAWLSWPVLKLAEVVIG